MDIEKDPKVSPIPQIIDQQISFMSQNVRSLRSETQRINLDAIIEIMIRKKNSAYCVQERWLDGDFVREINSYTMFHHGLKNQTCNRCQRNNAIILSP